MSTTRTAHDNGNDDENPPLTSNEDVDQGFAFLGLQAGGGKIVFHLNNDRLTIMQRVKPLHRQLADSNIPKQHEGIP